MTAMVRRASHTLHIEFRTSEEFCSVVDGVICGSVFDVAAVVLATADISSGS